MEGVERDVGARVRLNRLAKHVQRSHKRAGLAPMHADRRHVPSDSHVGVLAVGDADR